MAFIRARGLNAASSCAYLLPAMFRWEIGTYLRYQGSALEGVFPDNALLLEGFLLLPWALSWHRTYLAVFLYVFLFTSPSRQCTLRTGKVSYHCLNTQCLVHIMCSIDVCCINEMVMLSFFLLLDTPSLPRKRLYQLSTIGNWNKWNMAA